MEKFTIYGYHNPMLGIYTHDIISEERYLNNKEFFDKKYLVKKDDNSNRYFLYDAYYEKDGHTIKDFRKAKYFKLSKKCNFDVLYLQRNTVEYHGEDFASSDLKKVLDEAFIAGYNKVIIFDERLHDLSAQPFPLVGNDKQNKFKTQKDLEKFCLDCITPYKDYKNFYGVYLLDEPTFKTLPQVSLVYKTLKKVCPNIFVQANLLPLAGDASAVTGSGKVSSSLFVDVSLPENNGITVADAYSKYIDSFVQLSNAELITMDSYPIRRLGPYEDVGHYSEPEFYLNGNVPKVENSYFILNSHFKCLQTVANASKKYNIVAGGLSNSCGMAKVRDDYDNILLWSHKCPDKYDMLFQLNAYLCFGFKVFSYYVYWAKRDNGPACYHLEGSTFINQDGSKTKLYKSMQKIHKYMRNLEPLLIDAKYNAMSWLGNENLPYLKNCVKDNLKFIRNLSLLSGESAIITELVKKNGKTVYGVFYSSAPAFNGNSPVAKIKISFDNSVNKLSLYKFNKHKTVNLVNSSVELDLNYGDAVFLEL